MNWILTENRLPDDNRFVLVILKVGEVPHVMQFDGSFFYAETFSKHHSQILKWCEIEI